EGGQEAVFAIRDHMAVRIELRIDDGDILGMVTLFDEEERVVFSDIPDIGDRLTSHRRTSESMVHIDHVDQHESCYKESHCNIRPFTDATEARKAWASAQSAQALVQRQSLLRDGAPTIVLFHPLPPLLAHAAAQVRISQQAVECRGQLLGKLLG